MEGVMMRLLSIILVTAASIWGGYWFVGSTAVEKGLGTWLAEAPSNGLAAEYSTLETRGFPNRFDTTIKDISFSHAATGITWQAPFFRLFALSYKPNHIIAVWPESQRVILPEITLDIMSEDMRGSVVFEPNTSFAIDRTRLSIDELAVVPEGFTQFGAEHAFFASRQTTARPFAHDISVQLSMLELPEPLQEMLNPASKFPNKIDGLTIDATLGLTAPLGRLSEGDQPPVISDVSLKTVRIDWGELELSLNGTLNADDLGYAEGTLDLHAANWREVFQLLVKLGLVEPAWEGALAPLSKDVDGVATLDIPLTFENQVFYFGPLSFGTAPRLR